MYFFSSNMYLKKNFCFGWLGLSCCVGPSLVVVPGARPLGAERGLQGVWAQP